ncbi:MAG: exonuclease SbcCD subunit D [Clostridia bacterium]|nr:exonuclease SbcCD subunit D [Clostridia bacterium]
MKLVHLSDLHLGKRVNEFSMLEDQKHILWEILRIIGREKPEGVIIAGDVYDKAVPPAEAVALLDEFLVRLAGMRTEVFIISGNHDSAERIAFGSRLIRESGVHLSPVFSGEIEPCTLTDEYGEVQIRMLPFIKPADVRHAFPEEEIGDYTDAVRTVIRHMNPDPSVRNVLVAHQFVTGAERSDSEDVSVGGMDNVDASVFEPFDYVALGHIHGPQRIGRETVRYCGTPLKYSFSERNHVKSVTVVTLGEKGRTEIRTVPLIPLHDMREIRGTYEELTLRKNWEGTATDDYLHVILTDENDVPDAMARLRVIYPNIMKVDYDNQRTRTASLTGLAEEAERKSEMELFEEFYAGQNGQPLSGEQRSFAEALLEKLKEERA